MDKKQQCRHWFITIWFDHDLTVDAIREKLRPYDAYAGQLEKCPTTGKLHYHIIVEHSSPIKFETMLNKFPSSDIQPVRKKEAALMYVGKDETAYPAHDPVRFSKGKFTFATTAWQRAKLKFDDLHQAVIGGNTVDDLILKHPEAAWHINKLREVEQTMLKRKWLNTTRDLTVSYISGVSGAGKTHSVYEKHGFADTYVVDDYENPFDNYNGEKVVVFDEFHSDIEFGYLLKLLDKWPVALSARYKHKFAAFTEVYILSNERFENQYPEIQREKPASWEALKRRIHEVKHLEIKYEPETVPTPKEDEANTEQLPVMDEAEELMPAGRSDENASALGEVIAPQQSIAHKMQKGSSSAAHGSGLSTRKAYQQRSQFGRGLVEVPAPSPTDYRGQPNSGTSAKQQPLTRIKAKR